MIQPVGFDRAAGPSTEVPYLFSPRGREEEGPAGEGFEGRPVPLSDATAIRAATRHRGRGRLSEVSGRLPSRAVLCLIVALVCSGVLLLVLAGDVIFLRDEWAVVLDRRGFSAGTFLDPHVGHLALSVIAFYKLFLAIFGMTSPMPFHVGATVVYLVAGALLFVYARRRVGDWPALMAATVILFFGAGSVDLLSPFQIFFSGGIAAGLGALLALDREDPVGDVAACILLAVSMSFSEVGIAFTAGALVDVALGRRPRAGRLYVPLVPLALYGIWFLGWGHTGQCYLTLHNVGTTPAYVLDAVSAAIGSLAGLASASDALPTPTGQEWGTPLLVVAVALALWRVRRVGGVHRGVWMALAIGGTFWVLAGLNYFPGRAPGNGRYIYPSAVFVLLIAIELARGVRLSLRATLAVGALAAIAVAGNLVFLKDGNTYYFKPADEQERGAVSALDIAGPLNPSFVLNASVSPVTFFDIDTASYLSAVRAWGSPGYTPAELATSPAASRLEADKVLGAILGLRLVPGGGTSSVCRTATASKAGSTGVSLGPGRTTLASLAGSPVVVALARFSDELPVNAGTLSPASTASLTIPRDGASARWRLGLEGEGRVRVCGPGVSGEGG